MLLHRPVETTHHHAALFGAKDEEICRALRRLIDGRQREPSGDHPTSRSPCRLTQGLGAWVGWRGGVAQALGDGSEFGRHTQPAAALEHTPSYFLAG